MKISNADLSWIYGYASAMQFKNEVDERSQGLVVVERRFEPALELLKLNNTLFGENSKGMASMAQCYYLMNESDLALKCYKKSVELNPENIGGTEMIKKIEKELKKHS